MSLQLLWITQATTKKVEFESFQLACLSLFIYINLWWAVDLQRELLTCWGLTVWYVWRLKVAQKLRRGWKASKESPAPGAVTVEATKNEARILPGESRMTVTNGEVAKPWGESKSLALRDTQSFNADTKVTNADCMPVPWNPCASVTTCSSPTQTYHHPERRTDSLKIGKKPAKFPEQHRFHDAICMPLREG